LLRNIQIPRVKIEGPKSGGADEMVALTRALAIKQRLVNLGVAPERINVVGGTTARVKITVE
jgi:hypothetical protein